MINQVKEKGHLMCHSALCERDRTLQPVVSARLPWNLDMIAKLLNAEEIGCHKMDGSKEQSLSLFSFLNLL